MSYNIKLAKNNSEYTLTIQHPKTLFSVDCKINSIPSKNNTDLLGINTNQLIHFITHSITLLENYRG